MHIKGPLGQVAWRWTHREPAVVGDSIRARPAGGFHLLHMTMGTEEPPESNLISAKSGRAKGRVDMDRDRLWGVYAFKRLFQELGTPRGAHLQGPQPERSLLWGRRPTEALCHLYLSESTWRCARGLGCGSFHFVPSWDPGSTHGAHSAGARHRVPADPTSEARALCSLNSHFSYFKGSWTPFLVSSCWSFLSSELCVRISCPLFC